MGCPCPLEAEVGRLCKPGRLKLQGAMIVPLPSSLGGMARPCLKEKNTKDVDIVYYSKKFEAILNVSSKGTG